MAIKGRDNKMVKASNYMDGRISRTKVGRHFKFKTTFNSGFCLPLWCDEVYPGQNKSVNLGELVRSITPLGPTMDNSFLDLFFFFVPFRLVWDHWEEFIAGYNKEAWTQDVVYEVPQINFFKVGTYSAIDKNAYVHSFYDYLYGAGSPTDLAFYRSERTFDESGVKQANEAFSISALYPRAYVKIWNDWFRDENLQDELELYTGDNDEYAEDFAFNLLDASALPKLGMYHNRFTSLLPQPQKGPDVLIPMDNLAVNPLNGTLRLGVAGEDDLRYALANGNNQIYLSGDTVGSGNPNVVSTNLVANNVSNTIRQLRLATQTELLLARDARGGTRYVESLLSHFGVHNGDARLQRAEYLGSKQIPLQVMQVTNTAGTASDPLGNVGGQSVTKDNSHYFIKGFSEHGVVFCVGGVRTNISYSHGRRKMFSRKGRFDFIWPEFKHVGDVPCLKNELAQIYTTRVSESLVVPAIIDNSKVLGYTPYGSECRDGYNANSGLFRDNADGSLSYLTYQVSYVDENGSYEPTLSAEYIEQSEKIISNTLIDQNGPQFYALFDLYSEDVIPLDPTSDPGLMDHF